MADQYSRTELVIGNDAVEKLKNSSVLLFGVGGVGGAALEALARSGVGTIDIVDNDKFSVSNLNRQILSTVDNIGRYKVDVASGRVKSINPDVTVNCYRVFYLPETAGEFDFSKYDYVIDAVDTMSAKVDIVLRAKREGVPVISSMGCGNRMDPSKLKITDIYKTAMDPLAKIMRKKMKENRVKKLTVLVSDEQPLRPYTKEDGNLSESAIEALEEEIKSGKHSVPGSTAFVPNAAGLLIASKVVSDIIGFTAKGRTKGGKA